MDFKVNTKELHKYVLALAKFPEALQKVNARFLRDMAYNFHHFAMDQITGKLKYTIRDKTFFKGKAWAREHPNPSESIDKQRASVISLRIEGGSYGLFTGWEEELTGKTREMRNKGGHGASRTLTKYARDGDDFYGLSTNKFRMQREARMPDSSQYGLTLPAFLAMITKSDATGQSKRAKHFKKKSYATNKNKTFILSGETHNGRTYKRGLYTLVLSPDGDIKNSKIRQLQIFHEKPVQSDRGKHDWRGEAEKAVMNKFTPSYIWERYFKAAVDKILKR